MAQDPAAADLLAAQQAVERADRADADQYAPDTIALARQQLEQADLARAQSEEAVALAMLAQRRAEVERLQRQLATGEGH